MRHELQPWLNDDSSSQGSLGPAKMVQDTAHEDELGVVILSSPNAVVHLRAIVEMRELPARTYAGRTSSECG